MYSFFSYLFTCAGRVEFMKFIIKLHPEINIKSRSVRQRMGKLLLGNIRNVVKHLDENVKIRSEWDKIILRSKLEQHRQAMIDVLACVPGIQSYLEVEEHQVSTLDEILMHTERVFGSLLVGKTFCVRTKRRGQQIFSSLDVERHVGGGLFERCNTGGVHLKKPEVQVNLELDGERLYLVNQQYPGLGGYPIASQESVISLVSGGYDSGVSSYQFIKRGSRVHYCFFNLGGPEHEAGCVK